MMYLEYIAMVLVICMYFCIGVYPDSKIGWRFFFNLTSGIMYGIIGYVAGLYSLIPLQIFAVIMGYMQYRHFKRR